MPPGRISVMKQDRNKISRFAVEAVIFVIHCYKASVGRYLGGQCRFVPSCSEYAIGAVREFGAVKGSCMAARRILRCNPFGGRGFDPPDGI